MGKITTRNLSKLFVIWSIFIGLGVGSLIGCKSGKLEAGGAYNPAKTNIVTGVVTSSPDFAFFAVDSAFDFAFQTVDKIFLFEQQNRTALWAISHNIKSTLDTARPVAVSIVKRYALARRAYIAAPSPANLTTLQGILAEIQRLSNTVQAALPK